MMNPGQVQREKECQCSCHRWPGSEHVVPCCDRSGKLDPDVAERYEGILKGLEDRRQGDLIPWADVRRELLGD